MNIYYDKYLKYKKKYDVLKKQSGGVTAKSGIYTYFIFDYDPSQILEKDLKDFEPGKEAPSVNNLNNSFAGIAYRIKLKDTTKEKDKDKDKDSVNNSNVLTMVGNNFVNIVMKNASLLEITSKTATGNGDPATKMAEKIIYRESPVTLKLMFPEEIKSDSNFDSILKKFINNYKKNNQFIDGYESSLAKLKYNSYVKLSKIESPNWYPFEYTSDNINMQKIISILIRNQIMRHPFPKPEDTKARVIYALTVEINPFSKNKYVSLNTFNFDDYEISNNESNKESNKE